jgi:hypothetical protein
VDHEFVTGIAFTMVQKDVFLNGKGETGGTIRILHNVKIVCYCNLLCLVEKDNPQARLAGLIVRSPLD